MSVKQRDEKQRNRRRQKETKKREKEGKVYNLNISETVCWKGNRKKNNTFFGVKMYSGMCTSCRVVTSKRRYQSARHHIPEVYSLQQHRCENLRSGVTVPGSTH
jgi:hypothetical protein